MASVLTTLKNEFLETTRQSFNRIFPATNVDSLKRMMVRENPAEPNSRFLAAIEDPFIDDPLTQFTSFIGIPNAELEPNGRQSARNLFANFTGWRKNHSLARNVITSALLTPLHLAALPFNFVINCAKVFTEFLPRLLSMFVVQIGAKFIEAAKVPRPTFAKKLAGIGLYLIGACFVLLSYPLVAASIAFGALTSPIETVRAGWVIGKESSGRKGALMLGGAALFLVLAMYMIAFPFILKFVGFGMMKIAPKAVLNAINHVAPRFRPIFDAVGKGLTPLTKFLGKILGHHIGPIIAKMPIEVGISCFAGPITALSGNLYQPTATRFKRWFKREKPLNRILEHIHESSQASFNANQQLSTVRQRLHTEAAPAPLKSVTKPKRNCCLFSTRTRKSAELPRSVALPEQEHSSLLMTP